METETEVRRFGGDEEDERGKDETVDAARKNSIEDGGEGGDDGGAEIRICRRRASRW